MNIANKDKFLFEIFRVLKPGGYFALHDIFRNDGAPQVDFPVPWAENDSISFLTEWDNYKSLIINNGFIIKEEEDVTEPGINWINAMAERAAQAGQPPVSIQLVMGDTAGEKLKNVIRALNEKRIRVVQAVFHKT
jgi:nucleotide-binding universal stress UspA family protein